MTTGGPLAGLSPARKAELIYTQARTEMSSRLWEAAMGDAGRDKNASANAAMASLSGGNSLASLIAMMSVSENRPALPGASGVTAAGSLSDIVGAVGAGFAIAGKDRLEGTGAATAPREIALGLGPNSRFADNIAAAADRTGLPPSALAAIIDAEAGKHGDGGWNLQSRNPRSSAAGLGQFLAGTWLDMARKPGTWLNTAAREQGLVDAQGRVQPNARGELLAMRYDGRASIETIADYARINIGQLRAAGAEIGEDATALARSAYLGHHLGAGDAKRFLAGDIGEGRARTLLSAQIGSDSAHRHIASAGSASLAHRRWLDGYIDRHIRPDRYAL